MLEIRRPLRFVLFALAPLWAPAALLQAQNPAVTVSVDASADRHPIDPRIYGVAYGDAATLSDLRAPVNRLGGNNTSRYNWQVNADNRGSDWYFESIPFANTVGEVGDSFVTASRAGGAAPMLTIPMVGWVAKVGANRSKLSSFSIAKYGAQTGNDWQWFADAGNGVHPGGALVAGNDPNDASVPADSLFQQGWAQHLVTTWGTAGAGGVRYYLLDNEPSIWFSTHRDVHPVGPTMQEVRDKAVDYASRLKTVDPSALVVGPEEWGWSGYFYSGFDQQYGSQHGWTSLPDRASHGGADYLPWYLGQLRDASASAGRRLLDVFSVHYYPQGGEFSNDTSTAMQLRRNRSTRSLWDPAYVDETWINDRVELVPRLRGWVAANYPGTKIAITEYNWGAEDHINGATAQADVLGIFGREGLDMATRWTTPAASTPTYKAMKMYRNYDGAGSGFGDTSVRAQTPDPNTLSAFASVRASDGALTVVVVAKSLTGATPLSVTAAGFSARGPAQAWQLTAANAITRLPDVAISGGVLGLSSPAERDALRGSAVSDRRRRVLHRDAVPGPRHARRRRAVGRSLARRRSRANRDARGAVWHPVDRYGCRRQSHRDGLERRRIPDGPRGRLRASPRECHQFSARADAREQHDPLARSRRRRIDLLRRGRGRSRERDPRRDRLLPVDRSLAFPRRGPEGSGTSIAHALGNTYATKEDP